MFSDEQLAIDQTLIDQEHVAITEDLDTTADEATAQAPSRPSRKAKPRKHLTWGIERAFWKRGLYSLVGIDEAGRGPLAGPVVAAAVIFPYELCQKFPKDLKGLTDSKQLSEAEREDYFEAIKCHAKAFGIGIVGQQTIDEINILRATMQAMTIAVEQVVTSLATTDDAPDVLLIDGNYFRTSLPYEYKTVIDGDAKSRLIAAASVLAKVTRDHIMKDLHEHYPEYNFKQHKGYGTREHRAALRAHGPCPIHRQSFLHMNPDQTLLMFAEENIPLQTDGPTGS
jgi:ribonuclease HII